MKISSINPKNGQVIKCFEKMSLNSCNAIIDSCHKAFTEWRHTSFEKRSFFFKKVSRILLDNKNEYAAIMANEMGKVLKEGIAEVEKCVRVCDYYADNAESFLKPEVIKTGATKSYVTYNPQGVVLGVMPWNFPFWQVFRFAVPAVMAGNTVVLKHASNVTGCAMCIEDIFRKASFPDDIFRTIVIPGNQVADIISNPKVRSTTLTGSTPAGRSIGSTSGYHLKRSIVELGGSDPYLILEDADLDLAAEACVASRFLNAGQVCISAKRMIVVDSAYDLFLDKIKTLISRIRIGDPLDPDTDMGPMSRIDLRDLLHDQVMKSVRLGAKLVMGGEIPKMEGAFYTPTLLANVNSGMPAYDEELFGPVAAAIKVKSEREAIEVANGTAFGLGASVFSKDIERAERIAAFELEAGNCYVNTMVKSEPALPFGGIKESGYGKELSSHGLKELTYMKTVYVR